jgi:hypothetical protein
MTCSISDGLRPVRSVELKDDDDDDDDDNDDDTYDFIVLTSLTHPRKSLLVLQTINPQQM